MILRAILSCATLLAIATPATAAVSTWTLSGVKFDDGGTASGSFVFDSSLDKAVSEDISTTDGSLLLGSAYSRVYLSSAADAIQVSNNDLGNTTGSSLLLEFASDLVAGDTTSISFGVEQYAYYDPVNFENSYENDRYVTAGSVTSVGSVPEPGAWLMALVGFGTIGAITRGRRVRWQQI